MKKIFLLTLSMVAVQMTAMSANIPTGCKSVVKWLCATNRVEDDIGADRYLRSTCVIREGLESAIAHLYIDDTGMLKVDGNQVGSFADGSNWTRYFQKAGRHVVEVRMRNMGGPGGVCFALELKYKDGSSDHFHTDGSWEASMEGKSWYPAVVKWDALSGSWIRIRDMTKFLTIADAKDLQKRREEIFNATIAKTMTIIKAEKKPMVTKLNDRGRERIDIGGKLYDPIYYKVTKSLSGDDLIDRVAAFRDAGVHIFEVEGENLQMLEKAMHQVLTVDANAYFVGCIPPSIDKASVEKLELAKRIISYRVEGETSDEKIVAFDLSSGKDIAQAFATSLCQGSGFRCFDGGKKWNVKKYKALFRKLFPLRMRDADCRDYLMVYADKAGVKKVTLPKKRCVKELYPERKVIGEVDEFSVEAKQDETFIFATEDKVEQVDVKADTWVATDALGRKVPDADEVGPRKKRDVIMFYFIWHAENHPGPFDISKALIKDPDLMKHPDSPLLGPDGQFHWWGEPLLGYYVNTDKAVYRKHAQMLTDAGVDAIAFDCSNGPIYEEAWTELMDAFAEVEAAGGKAPKIAFFCPMAAVAANVRTLQASVPLRLWEKIYKKNLHPELWYRWEGKPLLLSYESYLMPPPIVAMDAIGPTRETKLRRPVRIEQGHTLGQKFTSSKPFNTVSGMCPTWHSKTKNSITARLKKEGPEGEVVAERRYERVSDNQQIGINDREKAFPAGTYYLELSEPVGTVGWWSRDQSKGDWKGAYVDGKPVEGYRNLHVQAFDEDAKKRLDFFTIRSPSSGGYADKAPKAPGRWTWCQTYPQSKHFSLKGEFEMMAVSVAENSNTVDMQPMSLPGAMGRRYHNGATDPDPKALLTGPNFQEQFDHALKADPPLIFITGWNEWIMSRINNYHHWYHPCGNFVDQYNAEFSRDAEPAKDYFGDNYYWQLISNLRRYRGARAIEKVRSGKITIDGKFDDWQSVAPEFLDTPGDQMTRDHIAWGQEGLRNIDRSGRNDIVMAKVSKAEDGVAFYVKTRSPFLMGTANNWMLLFIDVDCNVKSGWLGYDLAVRPAAPMHGEIVAKGEREMEIFLPAKAFPNGKVPDRFDFKWADNCLENKDWTDFALHGDAAPNGRFNYRAIFK